MSGHIAVNLSSSSAPAGTTILSQVPQHNVLAQQAPPPAAASSTPAAVTQQQQQQQPSQAQQEADITTLLTQLKHIEGDREQLLKQVELLQQKIGKLTEGKKAEMQKALDTVISDWLKESVDDENVREEFKKGMSRLVDQTAEESGVWRVVCCASTLHAKRLQEIETMRIEMDNMKRAVGSAAASISFSNDESRKRTHDQISTDPRAVETMSSSSSSSEPKNIWEEFAENMKGRVYEPPF